MRKITLFLMLLFAFSAMAQVNYGKRTWTFPATSHEAVTEVPAEIFTDFATQYSDTELTNEKVGVFVTDVRVAAEGDVTATFVYNGGNIRMDIGGVDLVNANGEVAYSDYHFGFAGGQLVDNVYTLNGVAVGDYTMRVFIPAQKEDVTSATSNDSKGTLTIAGAWMYPNEGVYYNIKNVRSNQYATFKGVGQQFKAETANNGAGSYWHFVKASEDDVKAKNNAWLEEEAIPAGYKPYYVYSAACEKAVENVGNGYMAAPGEQPWPAKLYYVGVQTNGDYTGLVLRPCNEDGSSWNDNNAGSVCHYSSGDAGSVWSIELANVADNDLLAKGTTAKTEAVAAANAYKTTYYVYAKPSVVDAAVAEIEGADISIVAKALTFVIEGTGTAIVNGIAESATILTPQAGDQFMVKSCRVGNLNDYLIAATEGDVKTTSGIGANDINALDLVWTLKTSSVDGKFNLYNERLGVYIAPLARTMGFVTEATEAGVYAVELKGANVLFHADGWGADGYIHHPGWSDKRITYWDSGTNSQWQLIEAPIELTTDIENPICYAIKSGRDGDHYFTLDNNKIKLINNADIVGNDNAKWFFMLDGDKNLKIYPYADKNNSMGYITVEDGNTKLTNDHSADGFVADTYTLYYNSNNAANNNGKCFAFRPTEGNTFVSNHGGAGNYMGFYNEHNDKGTRIGFENLNKVALTSKVETWKSYLANEGDKVCQYVIADDVKTAVTDAEVVVTALTSNNSNYATELATLSAYEFPTINLPQVGKFYRLKNGASGWYATSDLRTGEADHSVKLYMKEDGTQANTIWYVGENNALLSYTKGQYLGDMNGDWSFEVVGSTGNATTFVQGATIGKMQIKPSSGRSLYGDQVRVDAAGEENNSGNYEWILEEVTSLPVTVTAAGWATLYAPVAVELPAGLKAYYVSSANSESASLKEITGTVPANTGVLLEGEPEDYALNIVTGVTAVDGNLLEGTVASTYIAADAYALGLVGGEVGFYTATKNQQGNTSWLNNGFKAYLPKTSGASLALRFNFGGETTGIEGVIESTNANAAIFDLSGRRVAKMQKGIYIVNGKKVYVK